MTDAPGLSAHILPTSATMVGVCMTVLTLARLGHPGRVRTALDKFVALDAMFFLASAVLSFVSMRSRRRALYERRAESVFLIGLGLLVLAGFAIAFAID